MLSGANTLLKAKKVLIFSKTEGYHHTSIHYANKVLKEYLAQHGYDADTSNDASLIVEENLRSYAAIIFLSTTGDIFNAQQQADFERFIQAGGGFVGIHAATDTEYDWPWYNQFVGAYFASHPKQQDATIQVLDKNHPATKHLPDQWERFDEWYNFKSINKEVNVLCLLDESTYEGGENGPEHPFSWYHEFDGGRMFYTAGGHREDNYDEALFLKHILGGLNWVTSGEKLNYQNARSERTLR